MRTNTILIIEDEEIIRESLKDLLELEGYAVIAAKDGAEGLNALSHTPQVSLVLLDLFMPIMNGMEFLVAKNQNNSLASIPVCVISGVAEKPNLKNIVGYVKKPFEIDALLKVIKSFCGGALNPVTP